MFWFLLLLCAVFVDVMVLLFFVFGFFFKQKTAYELRISDWSSDVCSSDLFSQTGRSGRTLNGTLTMKRPGKVRFQYQKGVPMLIVGDGKALTMIDYEIGRAACRERVSQYV